MTIATSFIVGSFLNTGVQFQLLLSTAERCSIELVKPDDVKNSFVAALNDTCQCGFTAMHVTNVELACDPEVENGITFSARLQRTEQASTYELINHVSSLINDSATLNVHGGSEEQLVVEDLLAPLCPFDNDLETVEPAANSMSISAAEIVMWTFLAFLMLTIAIAMILSGVIIMLKRRLMQAKWYSQYVAIHTLYT